MSIAMVSALTFINMDASIILLCSGSNLQKPVWPSVLNKIRNITKLTDGGM